MAFLKLLFTIGTGTPERSKYGGMETSDVKRLKDLEEENTRLKKRPTAVDVCRSGDGQSNPKGPIHKKRLGPATKRQLAEEIVREQGIPVSRACQLVSLPRSQFYYSSKKDDTAVIDVLQNLAFAPLRRSESFVWIPKTVCL